MRILLLGHNGYLGSYLYNNIKADTLEGRILYNNGKEYDYVINCVGKADLEYCETNVELTNYSNWLIVEDIIKYYPTAKIINFSSYYVYDGDGLNNEYSPVTKEYAYTNQKLNAEALIKNGVSLRLGKLFGNGLAKQHKLTEYIILNNDLILDNVMFNPTSVEEVLKVVKFELSQNKLFGLYNLSNIGYISHYEYGVKINELLGTNKNIMRIDKTARAFHNYGKFLMDVSKLNSIIPLVNWEIDMNKFLKNNKVC